MTPVERFERYSSTAPLRGDLRGRSVRAFGYGFASGAGDFVIRIASTAILARLVSPGDFGLFMMVIAITAIADQFRDLGLSTATIQRERITHAEVSNLFWINVAAGGLLALVLCALAPLVAGYFREEKLTAIAAVLSVNFILGGLVVQHEALMTRQMRHGQKSLVRLTASLLSTVMAVGMAMVGLGYWALVWREICRSVLIVLGVGCVCRWIPGWPDRRTNVRGLVSFGKDLTLSYFFGVLSASMDRLLLGRAYGPEPVALYRQPYQLVVAPMNQFMAPLYQVVLPALSMLQGEPERFRRFYHRVVAVVAMFSMPLNVFLALYARELTLLLLGPKWQGAAVFFFIFALGGILRSVVSTTGFVLVSSGRSRPLLRMSVWNSLVMVLLMAVGLQWGPEGVALGEAASVVVMMGPWMYCSFKDSPVTISGFIGVLFRPAAASVIMGVVLLVFRQAVPIVSAPWAVMAGMTVAGVTLLVAWLVLPGGRLEIHSLWRDTLNAVRRSQVPSPVA